jgi:methionyl-tRNA formyltransferase
VTASGLAAVPEMPKRLAFLGTPAVAVGPLRALVDAGFPVAHVVTGVDKRRGRGAEIAPSPVALAASELSIPVSHAAEDLLALDPPVDLGVVVAYGRLVKRPVLESVPMVNLHFSLLPRWRGAAPVERAILAGDSETGVAVMQLEEGLDTGPVYALERTPIGERETADQLRDELATAGSQLLVSTLRHGLRDPRPQEGEPTYASKISPAELVIDWTQEAEMVDRVVRVGGASTSFRGKRLKIVAAEPVHADLAPGVVDAQVVGCGRGALRLLVVQPEGRAAMDAAAWLRGARPHPGEHLGG